MICSICCNPMKYGFECEDCGKTVCYECGDGITCDWCVRWQRVEEKRLEEISREDD